MTLKDIIKEIITLFHNSPQPHVVERNLELPINLEKIISVIGVRRSGKTYILFDTINKLISKGIAKKNIIYINFEDERLQLTRADLDIVLQAYRELYPDIKDNEVWFFFDEIQNVDAWEKFIRRIYDTCSKHVFISGSNALFLSSDIATSLRGRSISFEVFPYTFDEYLRHQNIHTSFYLPQNKAKILNAFYTFLSEGGFPEVVSLSQRYRLDILRNYFYVMLYKDLIERYSISSANVLKYFIERLATNITKSFSVNKIYNEMRSHGYKMDKNLLYDLLAYIENIYLAFRVSKFDFSFSKRNRSDKKVYFIDNGLVNSLVMNFSDDIGKLLENAVFLFLRHNYGELYSNNIYFHKASKECDFLIYDRQKIVSAAQVSHHIDNQNTLNRETEGLKSALISYNLDKGLIITSEQELEISDKDFKIEVIPAYKLFLNKKFSIY
ncbi:MAG: ATP-binding protein [Bacteroidota bacterium]|nr:ATP-binding protein [Bacteroidota bacterium]